MAFNKSRVIYNVTYVLQKRKQKYTRVDLSIRMLHWTRKNRSYEIQTRMRNSWNKLIQMILLKCHNVILIFPMECLFFGKIRYGFLAGNKMCTRKDCMYDRTNFSKSVTAINSLKIKNCLFYLWNLTHKDLLTNEWKKLVLIVWEIRKPMKQFNWSNYQLIKCQNCHHVETSSWRLMS